MKRKCSTAPRSTTRQRLATQHAAADCGAVSDCVQIKVEPAGPQSDCQRCAHCGQAPTGIRVTANALHACTMRQRETMRSLRMDTYESVLQARSNTGFVDAILSVIPWELPEVQASLEASGFTVSVLLESAYFARILVGWTPTHQ
jgi:hypothetical protein